MSGFLTFLTNQQILPLVRQAEQQMFLQKGHVISRKIQSGSGPLYFTGLALWNPVSIIPNQIEHWGYLGSFLLVLYLCRRLQPDLLKSEFLVWNVQTVRLMQTTSFCCEYLRNMGFSLDVRKLIMLSYCGPHIEQVLSKLATIQSEYTSY